MSFKEILEAEADSIPGPKCTVFTWRATLGEDDRNEFDQASADSSIRHSTLQRAMKQLGFRAGQQTVSRHRNHECSCG